MQIQKQMKMSAVIVSPDWFGYENHCCHRRGDVSNAVRELIVFVILIKLVLTLVSKVAIDYKSALDQEDAVHWRIYHVVTHYDVIK